MALVQALPVSAEPHNPGLGVGARRRHPSGSSPPPLTLEPMGSVGSLISTRPGPYLDHHAGAELGGARGRRQNPGASSPQDPLVHNNLPLKKQSSTTSSREPGNANYAYLNEEYVDDWNDNYMMPASPGSDVEELKGGPGLNVNMEGPPPKLIPVSGKLEKVIQRINVPGIFIVGLLSVSRPHGRRKRLNVHTQQRNKVVLNHFIRVHALFAPPALHVLTVVSSLV